jgi:hypothetical protein
MPRSRPGQLLIWYTECGQRRAAAMLGDMDVEEFQRALGAIVLEAAYLERILRTSFSVLVDSKYAAVIDGRWSAFALIEDCEQIVKHHTGIPEPAKQKLLAALILQPEIVTCLADLGRCGRQRPAEPGL